MSSFTPSRRGVLTASAWAVPTVVVASAAPAFANSLCVADVLHTVQWGRVGADAYSFVPAGTSAYGPGQGRIAALPTLAGLTAAEQGVVAPLVVTVQNTFSSPDTNNPRMAGYNGTYQTRTIQNMRVTGFPASGFGHGALTLAQQKSGSSNFNTPANHYQLLTLAFSRPVKNLKFKIGDIDASSGNHSDRVTLDGSRNFSPSSSANSSVRGDGTGSADGNQPAVGPWRPSNNNSILNDTTATAGNVSVTYGSTAISVVQLRFWNNLAAGGMQWIFLSDLEFTASTCA